MRNSVCTANFAQSYKLVCSKCCTMLKMEKSKEMSIRKSKARSKLWIPIVNSPIPSTEVHSLLKQCLARSSVDSIWWYVCTFNWRSCKTQFQNECTNQGRKMLPKTGWVSSNMACRCRHAAAWRRLLFCQKLGGQLPTLPTRYFRPWWYSFINEEKVLWLRTIQN